MVHGVYHISLLTFTVSSIFRPVKLRYHCGVGRGWWSSCWPTPSAASSPQCCLTLWTTDRSDISQTVTKPFDGCSVCIFCQLTSSQYTVCSVNIYFSAGRDSEQDYQEVRAGRERLRQRATQPGRGRAKWGWEWWGCPISFHQLMSFIR